MHAGHDDKRHCGREDRNREPWNGIVECCDAGRKNVAENRAQRAEDNKHDRGADQQEEHRLEECLENIRRYSVCEIFRPAHDRGHQQHRKNRTGVGSADNRNHTEDVGAGLSEECAVTGNFRTARKERNEIRVAQHRADDHVQRHAVAGLLRNTPAEHNRQHIEEGIRHREENGIGRSSRIHDTDGGEKDEKNLDHTCAEHRRQKRCKAACHKAEQSLKRISLCLHRRRSTSFISEVSKFLEFLEQVGYFISDDDLVLAALFDHGFDALDAFYRIVICLSFILEDKTETRHAVGCGRDVVNAADRLSDLF